MKRMSAAYSIALVTLFGCNSPLSLSADLDPVATDIRVRRASSVIEVVAKSDDQPKAFNIDFAGVKLSATIDADGSVIILDYPTKQRAKSALIRFDGQTGVESPFSPGHCKMIKSLASNPYSKDLVRSGYYSVLSFEIPPFLSEDFQVAVMESANAAGHNFTSIYIKNPVDRFNGQIELTFDDSAISLHLGHTWILRDQLNLSRNGMRGGPFERRLTIYAADIICDLISHAAKLTMIYPIVGEERVIKVVYDPMENRL